MVVSDPANPNICLACPDLLLIASARVGIESAVNPVSGKSPNELVTAPNGSSFDFVISTTET